MRILAAGGNAHYIYSSLQQLFFPFSNFYLVSLKHFCLARTHLIHASTILVLELVKQKDYKFGDSYIVINQKSFITVGVLTRL